MQLERIRRSSEQVSRHKAKALLANIHLRELIRKATDTRRLVDRTLAKSGSVDVFGLRLRTSIVRGLLPRLPAYLLLRELALRR